MRRNQFAAIPILRLVLVLSAATAVHAQAEAPQITFTVSMSRPATHLLEVEMRVRQDSTAPATDLIMPVWTPGSYLIREFERNVQDFAADADGHRLESIKVNKNTWRVRTAGAREWRVTYLQLQTGEGTATPKPYLAADLSQNGDRLIITSVRAGSPAYEQGLNANDQIVALHGARVNRDSFQARLAETKPGARFILRYSATTICEASMFE
jgi:predicted metalloprotease with PDZ domain